MYTVRLTVYIIYSIVSLNAVRIGLIPRQLIPRQTLSNHMILNLIEKFVNSDKLKFILIKPT